MTKKEREKARKMASDAIYLEFEFERFKTAYSYLNLSENTLRGMFYAGGAMAIKHLQRGNYSDVKVETFHLFGVDAIKRLKGKD
jgi:hypothetical protein